MQATESTVAQEEHLKLLTLHACLDENSSPSLVDLEQLRNACSIPARPPGLRPVAYDLLLGLLPLDKTAWKSAREAQRRRYYVLLDKLMTDISQLPPPTESTSKIDRTLISAARLAQLLPDKPFFGKVSRRPFKNGRINNEDPISKSSRAIFGRLKDLSAAKDVNKSQPGAVVAPGITITEATSTLDSTPGLSLTLPEDAASSSSSPITLLSPRSIPPAESAFEESDDTNRQTVLRMLSVFLILNPQWIEATGLAQIIATLLEVYSTHSHAEEYAYWAATSICNSVEEVVLDPSRTAQLLDARLRWADPHYAELLSSAELDPISANYLPEWISSLFVGCWGPQALPTWDYLVSADPVNQNRSARILDIGISILHQGREDLFKDADVRGFWTFTSADQDTDEDVVRSRKLAQIRLLPMQMDPHDIIQLAQSLEQSQPNQLNAVPASSTSPGIERFWKIWSTQSSPAKQNPTPAVPSGPPSSQTSLQERLSRLMHTPATITPTSVPKPLLLSEKARRASHGTPTRSKTDSPATPPSEMVLSPPPVDSPLYPIRSKSPARQLFQDDNERLLVTGLCLSSKLPRLARIAPLVVVAAARYRSSAAYEGHQPLSRTQNAFLAVGSGVMGVLNTSRGDLVATLSETTASTFLPALHSSMTHHPEGRQIMKDRPFVSSSTVDLEALSKLQRGTLGREYVEWLKRGNVTPDTRAKVEYIDSPTLAYTMLRYRQTHDLYHTLFSLPPTLPHELSLKVLELSNMSLPVAALSSTFGPFRLSAPRRAVWLQDWAPWALRTGRAGRSLVGVYWEKRWEQGLGDLRGELGVARNDDIGVESRWKGYHALREDERNLRRTGEWIDEPES